MDTDRWYSRIDCTHPYHLAYRLLYECGDAVAEMHEPIGREISVMREAEVIFKKQDPFSVLLLGVDEREGDAGRSDTIVAMTVNPTEQSTKMVNIPRDTYTTIVGRNTKDKINHAYAFGGTTMAVASVESLLDIPSSIILRPLIWKGLKALSMLLVAFRL